MDDDLPSGSGPEEFSAQIFGAYESGGEAGLELAPFRGVRFAPGRVDLAAVTTPPYDLISEAEMRRLLESDARNIVRLILPWDGVRDPGTCYDEAAELLGRWMADGTLVTDPEPALYVYEERNASSLQRGLIGALGLRPESARVVLPHEDVFPGPVRDRLRLMTAAQANLEPIFLLYEGDGGDAGHLVDEIATSAEPDVQVTADDGLTHRLWRVADPGVQARISADLRGRQALIADGHHRYATYRALQARHHAAGDGPGPWDHGLALLVDSTRYPPHLGAIHRVLPGLDPAVAIERAKAAFRVTEHADALEPAMEALRRESGPAFLIAGGSGFHLLTDPDPVRLRQAMPTGHSQRWQRLDTAILDRLLIERIWEIPANEHTVEIVHHDAATAVERARRAGGTAAILNPLRVEDVLALAAGGERVPRKSTSFGPKPRTGLILRLFDAG